MNEILKFGRTANNPSQIEATRGLRMQQILFNGERGNLFNGERGIAVLCLHRTDTGAAK